MVRPRFAKESLVLKGFLKEFPPLGFLEMSVPFGQELVAARMASAPAWGINPVQVPPAPGLGGGTFYPTPQGPPREGFPVGGGVAESVGEVWAGENFSNSVQQ